MYKRIYRLITLLPAIFLIFITTSCNSDEKKAATQLKIARELFEANDFNQAKVEIDNIRTFYPKQFKTIRQGNQLMKEIEIKEQERTLVYCDSVLKQRENEVDSVSKGFVLQKDEDDAMGFWKYETQTTGKNINRTYLRCSVEEKGRIILNSVYCGSGALNHTRIKVENKAGEFCESLDIPQDGANNYTFKDLGNFNEIVSYYNGKDNGVIRFIDTYANEEIKVTLIGKKNFSFILNKADKDAICASFALASTLSEIEKMKQEIKLSTAKVDYLRSKMAEYNAKDNK